MLLRDCIKEGLQSRKRGNDYVFDEDFFSSFYRFSGHCFWRADVRRNNEEQPEKEEVDSRSIDSRAGILELALIIAMAFSDSGFLFPTR